MLSSPDASIQGASDTHVGNQDTRAVLEDKHYAVSLCQLSGPQAWICLVSVNRLIRTAPP